MRIYEIINEEDNLSVGTLLYYEKEHTCIVELQEYLDEWTAPLLFTSHVKRDIFTIPRDFSFLWVQERVIPSGRQNIKDILNTHHMKSYDEMRFLEISEGRCAQDTLYIKKTDHLPEYVIKRQQHNITECIFLNDCTLLCFFADGSLRKIPLAELKNAGYKNAGSENTISESAGSENTEFKSTLSDPVNFFDPADDLNKVLRNEKLYRTGQVGTGGYFITFNNSIDIPAGALYKAGVEIPLSLEDFNTFVQKNIFDTSQSCDLLECSRQNLSYLVNQKRLTPVRENTRGNLYLKGDLLKSKW